MKKKNSIRLLPLGLLLLVIAGMLLAACPLQAQPTPDSLVQEAQWQQRSFSSETLRRLQEDADLEYPVVVAEDGWWSRLKYWFFTKVFEAIGGVSGSRALDIMMYLFCIAAGIFIILRFLDIDLTTLVQRRARIVPVGRVEGLSENIHVLDFDQEIARAVQQQEYKRAVRLVYLAALKKLSDAGVVRWEPGKTNRQYQLELKDPASKQQFARLGYFFEWAWYGDFPVDEPLFQQVAQEYRQFCKQLEVRA